MAQNNPPLPVEVQYGNFKPKGYYTTFKQWPITPMSSNQYWTPDQIVRFLVTVKNGVMDPYRSHIQIMVTVPETNYPVGGLQVDNSAQGFIAQTVVSSNNVQIERITQYDTLSAYLTDIGFSQYVCESRITQGLGYSNISSHTPWFTQPQTTGGMLYNSGSQWTLENNVPGLKSPGTMPFISGRGNSSNTTQFLMDETTTVDSTQVTCANGSVISGGNILWSGGNQYVSLQTTLQTMGRFSTVRQEYASSLVNGNFPDTNLSLLQTSPRLLNQTFTINNLTNNNTLSGFNPKAPYELQIPQTSTFQAMIPGGALIPMTVPNTCNLFGYQKPISGQFTRGTCQTILSPTIPQCQMQNGVILPSKIPVNTQLFRLPLISSICGILIPPDQFLLIPMQSLYNMLLEITLSRYAMFTTGYSDVHEFDQYGMSVMQQRKWVISQIYWNIHLYTFSDQSVNQQIQASLVKSIPISSFSYTLASQFQLPNGQVVRNTWPVGSQSQSLCQVICLFLSNEYNQYSFCRKQFRLSNNISSMQIKFGTQFFPSQPIIGNAGNPYTLDTTGDCWPFYEQLLLSTNFLFNTNVPLPKINSKNFCINKRCYNTGNSMTYYDPAMFTNSAYSFNSNSVNYDTAMGMSHFHQNRYVGKAAFVYSWEPYGHSKNYMTGLNTQGVQNFSVIFNTTGQNPFPSDQTLLIFTRCNVIVVYTKDGVKVIGK